MRLALARILPALILVTSCADPSAEDLDPGSVESTESAAHGANDWYELRLPIVPVSAGLTDKLKKALHTLGLL